MTLPTDKTQRKGIPLASVLDYFPDALAEVARVIKVGNDQHNPGEPIHWARGKSDDHEDCLLRHFTERGAVDTDGCLHSAKMAWRALAILQLEIEKARGLEPSRGSKSLEEAWPMGQVPEEMVAHAFWEDFKNALADQKPRKRNSNNKLRRR